MKSQKILLLLGCLGLVIVLIFSYSFYKERSMYEDYLISNVGQDIVEMKSAINNNEIIFDSILTSDKITNQIIRNGEQAEQVTNNLTEMMQILDKYSLMNQSFNKNTNILTKPAKPLIVSLDQNTILPSTLLRMRMTFERLDYTSYPLTPESKARIKEYRQLNSRWLKIVGDTESTEINVKDLPQFLSDIENETQVYFQEQDINFKEDELWKDSLNPRYTWE
ncbi:hypothetical protein MH215_12345 [Paenibacillus sp. ACRSA]|uniref:hypothetical protein n=1 Tax=Paenibacillus sp. ACRSA TaxID=2918211 RepID=UPI001EF6367C|nr:hypothetical protein [Paenibacillus sp. ACRSA]MCG7377786.1 hypothetical protein [Paenibacillus sp. ACRSA]